ncbi:UPF0721 transmembrane protein [Virgisporangium aliadipatigenens]|uniref:Probable membrane transporter protein n=1 Tax=Virgisporangium aliadipatigenens TaxID=741659 RepID=A0A8J3YM47_9ACTN|nr:sulfite exporter TauE/SafE family protein [Virgisporangium aliadipatigenens]GIJ46386.1 UPF0721 transmembrane protein [Virgisporangium aliadipatigenens]
MNLVEALAVLLAGVVAGGMNAVVGSGTLVTFPTLLAFGYPPVLANVSNNVGLVPGSASGAYGYREKLTGLGPVVLRLAVASTLGGLTGAILLLYLPAAAFKAIVPVLLGIALVMVVLQPRLSKRLAERAALQPAGAPGRAAPQAVPGGAAARVRHVGPLLLLGVYGGGIYGGYFGAAQGVLLIGLLGTMYTTDLQEANAIKNVLAGVVNAVAAVVFVLVAEVAWLPAILIAVGSTAGGLLGARYGRRLPQNVLRALIVVVGVVAIVRLLIA